MELAGSTFFVQIVEGNCNETWQIKVILYVLDDYFWVDPALNLAKSKAVVFAQTTNQ